MSRSTQKQDVYKLYQMNLPSRNGVGPKGQPSPQSVPQRSHWQVDLD